MNRKIYLLLILIVIGIFLFPDSSYSKGIFCLRVPLNENRGRRTEISDKIFLVALKEQLADALRGMNGYEFELTLKRGDFNHILFNLGNSIIAVDGGTMQILEGVVKVGGKIADFKDGIYYKKGGRPSRTFDSREDVLIELSRNRTIYLSCYVNSQCRIVVFGDEIPMLWAYKNKRGWVKFEDGMIKAVFLATKGVYEPNSRIDVNRRGSVIDSYIIDGNPHPFKHIYEGTIYDVANGTAQLRGSILRFISVSRIKPFLKYPVITIVSKSDSNGNVSLFGEPLPTTKKLKDREFWVSLSGTTEFNRVVFPPSFREGEELLGAYVEWERKDGEILEMLISWADRREDIKDIVTGTLYICYDAEDGQIIVTNRHGFNRSSIDRYSKEHHIKLTGYIIHKRSNLILSSPHKRLTNPNYLIFPEQYSGRRVSLVVYKGLIEEVIIEQKGNNPELQVEVKREENIPKGLVFYEKGEKRGEYWYVLLRDALGNIRNIYRPTGNKDKVLSFLKGKRIDSGQLEGINWMISQGGWFVFGDFVYEFGPDCSNNLIQKLDFGKLEGEQAITITEVVMSQADGVSSRTIEDCYNYRKEKRTITLEERDQWIPLAKKIANRQNIRSIANLIGLSTDILVDSGLGRAIEVLWVRDNPSVGSMAKYINYGINDCIRERFSELGVSRIQQDVLLPVLRVERRLKERYVLEGSDSNKEKIKLISKEIGLRIEEVRRALSIKESLYKGSTITMEDGIEAVMERGPAFGSFDFLNHQRIIEVTN